MLIMVNLENSQYKTRQKKANVSCAGSVQEIMAVVFFCGDSSIVAIENIFDTLWSAFITFCV